MTAALAGKDGHGTAPTFLEGLVLSHLGQALAIEGLDGRIVLCHTRRQLGSVAVGDRVLWSPVADGQGRVETILPRHSVLNRPAHGGRIRPVAANLDQIVIVVASQPEPDWLLVDQYAAACEHRSLKIAIVVNKMDRVNHRQDIASALKIYGDIGYVCHPVSARTGEGLDDLRKTLGQHCSLLAGQSGVGKSSLTNALLPGKSLRTRELSEKAGLGRHTTTTAMLYHLPDGGDLIDSPGVAVFGLAEMGAADLAWGYREFRHPLDNCRFKDCRHLNDHGCAIRAAMENGRISRERYDRYQKLLAKMRLN